MMEKENQQLKALLKQYLDGEQRKYHHAAGFLFTHFSILKICNLLGVIHWTMKSLCDQFYNFISLHVVTRQEYQ